jgi:hypothetical protein
MELTRDQHQLRDHIGKALTDLAGSAGLEIRRTLVCSTSHLTEAEAQAIQIGTLDSGRDDADTPQLSQPTIDDYCWDFYVGQIERVEKDGKLVDDEPYDISALSDGFQLLIRLCWALDIAHLVLDQDGPVIDGIQTHVW